MHNTRKALIALFVAVTLDARHHCHQLASLVEQGRLWLSALPARARLALAASLAALSRRIQALAVRLDPSLDTTPTDPVDAPAPTSWPLLATIDAEPRRAYARPLHNIENLAVARCRLAPVARPQPTPLLADRRVPTMFGVDEIAEAIAENPWSATTAEILAAADKLGLPRQTLLEQEGGQVVAQVAFAAKDAEVLVEAIETEKRAAAQPRRVRPKAAAKPRRKAADPDRDARIAAAIAAVEAGTSVRIAAREHGVAESTLRTRLKRLAQVTGGGQ